MAFPTKREKTYKALLLAIKPILEKLTDPTNRLACHGPEGESEMVITLDGDERAIVRMVLANLKGLNP